LVEGFGAARPFADWREQAQGSENLERPRGVGCPAEVLNASRRSGAAWPQGPPARCRAASSRSFLSFLQQFFGLLGLPSRMSALKAAMPLSASKRQLFFSSTT
jgi:hypothetical protein